MSSQEIQEIIHRPGVFIFRGGATNEGMLVARYNIRKALIEYYFIQLSRLTDFINDIRKHDPGAAQRHGNIVDVNSIITARLFGGS